METTSEALVLKKVPYSGSSLILSAYSRNYGLMSFMVRGLGKKRGSKLAMCEPLSLLEITFHHREKYGVQTVKEMSPLNHSGGLFFDPLKGAVSLFLAEVLQKSLREESPDDDLFGYLSSSITYFREAPFNPDFHLVFLSKLTRFLGFWPQSKPSRDEPYFDLQNGEYTSQKNQSLHVLNSTEASLFYSLFSSDYSSEIGLKANERRTMLQALVEYYRLQLEGFGNIKSLQVLSEVFS